MVFLQLLFGNLSRFFFLHFLFYSRIMLVTPRYKFVDTFSFLTFVLSSHLFILLLHPSFFISVTRFFNIVLIVFTEISPRLEIKPVFVENVNFLNWGGSITECWHGLINCKTSIILKSVLKQIEEFFIRCYFLLLRYCIIKWETRIVFSPFNRVSQYFISILNFKPYFPIPFSYRPPNLIRMKMQSCPFILLANLSRCCFKYIIINSKYNIQILIFSYLLINIIFSLPSALLFIIFFFIK